MRKIIAAAVSAGLVLCSGCQQTESSSLGSQAAQFVQISQEEAKSMIDSGEDLIILDVRRQDEFDQGHIPGAVLLPNESIFGNMPAELPDTSQKILVYCRSGNRSKQAAQKLADMGYTNVYEFGGIITWPYDVVSGETEPGTAPETEPAALLSSPADIALTASDSLGNYTFIYGDRLFYALSETDNWHITNSYLIENDQDILMICRALAEEAPVHTADLSGWRSPEDMASEWKSHNYAYRLLPEGSPYKDDAKDVDLDAKDSGKTTLDFILEHTGLG
ncbi:MAG: rhodanese-like domain-containing protein [Ruminococcus sp.]|nr:rhodanese-like domain-containing protein [Ruminococcus sp.]